MGYSQDTHHYWKSRNCHRDLHGNVSVMHLQSSQNGNNWELLPQCLSRMASPESEHNILCFSSHVIWNMPNGVNKFGAARIRRLDTHSKLLQRLPPGYNEGSNAWAWCFSWSTNKGGLFYDAGRHLLGRDAWKTSDVEGSKISQRLFGIVGVRNEMDTLLPGGLCLDQ